MSKPAENIETTENNPFCPKGWGKEDLVSASREFQAMQNGRAFQWIGHYLGAAQRRYEGKSAPTHPAEVSHAQYIENGSRINELVNIWNALTILTGLENEIRKDQENGEQKA